jgi:hypothetical protein
MGSYDGGSGGFLTPRRGVAGQSPAEGAAKNAQSAFEARGRLPPLECLGKFLKW